MTTKKIWRIGALMILLPFTTTLSAQTQGESEYRYHDAIQIWRNTDNAAGLTLDSTRNRGYAQFDFNHHDGDYHRVQEGGMSNDLTFFTERYQQMGKYLYGYGKFRFNMGRTKDRAWCDVMRPYNNAPYYSGSAVFGKYERQDIDLTAAVGTVSFNGWRFGARLDYQVGDLSRLRDPRSRSELLDYQLTPSVTYTMGQHTLGLLGFYNRRKEKIPNITTVQTDATLKYYLMTGMENAVGTAGGFGGFQREWVNHCFGTELSYGFQENAFQSLTGVSIQRGSEGIYGQYKYEPGHYYTYLYGLQTQNRLKTGRLLHQIDLTLHYKQGYGDEYRQQLEITTDPQTGLNSYHYINQMTYKKRYQVSVFDLDVHYRMNFTQEEAVDGYAGMRFAMQTTRNKYLLDTSEMKYRPLDLTVEGGYAFLKRTLWLDAEVGYHHPTKACLSLADETTDYAQGVLLPDQLYYNANYWRGKLQVTYQFPLTIKKVRSTWFVKGYVEGLKAQDHLDSHTFGVTVGLFN